MINFRNANYTNFLLETQDKRIICYGAGGTLRDFLKNNRVHAQVMDKIDFIFDRDSTKAGEAVDVGVREVTITAFAEISKCEIDFSKHVIIICISQNCMIDVLVTLDKIPELDGVVCYYGISGISWGREPFVPAKAGKQILPVCHKNYSIPKVLHYIWFGGKPFGKVEQECIESWKKVCPDYELRFWNEDNYDISTTPRYVRQAYEAKKYAFVSDYARLDIVNQYGGFYLDTDVLLLRSLDKFTKYKAAYGYLPYNEISTGLCFGSAADNEDLVGQMMIYENISFLYDGEYNLTPCPEYTTDYFRGKGFDVNNRLCLFDDTLFLPSDWLCGLMPVICENHLWHLPLYELTENTHAIHKCTSTWMEDVNYKAFENAKNSLAAINARLLADWKRKDMKQWP